MAIGEGVVTVTVVENDEEGCEDSWICGKSTPQSDSAILVLIRFWCAVIAQVFRGKLYLSREWRNSMPTSCGCGLWW